ncbi:tRNA pseudouridine synthase D [Hysterangium stoloniferum]|nr:tRNA pseudouridine synthase D [Hysterangium stoloniferum]
MINTEDLNVSSRDSILPASRRLLPHQNANSSEGTFPVTEQDVGISEYISHDVPQIAGIIKQRFTDFLVFEVDVQGDVVHLKSILEPELPKATETAQNIQNQNADTEIPAATRTAQNSENPNTNAPPKANSDDGVLWSSSLEQTLSPFLSTLAIEQLKEMFTQGPEPPLLSDSGWAGRQQRDSKVSKEEKEDKTDEVPVSSKTPDTNSRETRGKRGKSRGGRGGRGGKGGRNSHKDDPRRVVSEPIVSKQDRTALHETIRTQFKGKLETETDRGDIGKEDGQRIIIKWSKSKEGNVKRGNKEAAIAQGGSRNPFPYIHFTMQKTNRDTHDALSHLARQLNTSVKDLCVSGTKDKRGVTTQRVSFKRNGKTVQDVWKTVNGITSRRTIEQVISQRGERGIRIGDLTYRKGFLELGMLKGNAFVITLRNVQVDSIETMERALDSLKDNGFINYYGMQRFGTASIPTHSIGLALLRSDWKEAVSLIMRPRPGEYPEADAARRAWADEKDLEKALALMPRRVVAERCILESYQQQGGEDRNALGALSTIPKNLRLMYVHAYQSYVWNAIVSERLRVYGHKPIVGDLVFSTADDIEEITADGVNPAVTIDGTLNEDDKEHSQPRTERKAYQPPRIKVLGPDDLQDYTIFDVIMPLPGTDVAYPEGPLGEKYREFMRLDGLDPDNFQRKQRDYTLGGSYRKILHLPKDLSWSTMRYTDPDVALAQSDEDQILGFDAPTTESDGPFLALQIRMQLGTAAYATMALREITKTETSSHHQSALTQASDDQKFKGTTESVGYVQ